MAFKDFLNAVVETANEWAQKQEAEYTRYSQMYSRMGKEQLKREWERNKSNICSKPARKRAFREACKNNGIIRETE